MTKQQPPEGFPARFDGVTLRDIDLDTEEFVVGGKRLTEARAAEMVERHEQHVGRPSLTGRGVHSPALNVRISQHDQERLETLAGAQGRRRSDVVRDALAEYLDRHAS